MDLNGIVPGFTVFIDYLNILNTSASITGTGNYDQLYVLGLMANYKLIKCYLPLFMNWNKELMPWDEGWSDNIRLEVNLDIGAIFNLR